MFAASTTVGEALGWYGGAMLLGLAVLPVMIQLLTTPSLSDRYVRRSSLRSVDRFCITYYLLPFTFVGLVVWL